MGKGFALAHARRGSKVRREVVSVYDLTPERLGMFDLVFCSDLLLHLKAPILALEAIRRVTRGEFHYVEIVNPLEAPLIEYRGGEERCVWWSFTSGALERMVRDAGFSEVKVLNRFRLGHRGEKPQMWHVVLRASV
jgi:tRNA (mo5U34)-methyltransferase